ncbi:MAG: dihydroorotase [Treponema sp.]|nr:dihydroorotase [Treponema sp.]
MKKIIYNARLVDAKIDSHGMLVCENGRIESIFLGDFSSEEKARKSAGDGEFLNAEGLSLMPAFIDMHAHFRYPGQTQKEDLESGMAAATAAGFGTLVLMPNTNPVISNRELASSVMAEAEKINEKNGTRTRIFQTVSITKDFGGTDTSAIDELDSETFPVISEDGHDVGSASVMLEGMEKAGKKGIIVACHCEDVELAKSARPFRQNALKLMKDNGIPAGIFNIDLPNVSENVNAEIDKNLTRANEILALAEDAATMRNLEIAALAKCHVHICHCSTKISIDAVRNAKSRGIDCSVEVTPHHLGLTGTELPNIRALVNPPLRSENDRRALIEALRDGTADCIGTDHAPHTMDDKAAGSPGFTGLETAFAVVNTVLCKEEGFSLSRLSQLMSANPAKLLKLDTGRLEVGMQAEFALVNPDEKWVVSAKDFKSKGKSTPLEGKTLVGKVHKTIFA